MAVHGSMCRFSLKELGGVCIPYCGPKITLGAIKRKNGNFWHKLSLGWTSILQHHYGDVQPLKIKTTHRASKNRLQVVADLSVMTTTRVQIVPQKLRKKVSQSIQRLLTQTSIKDCIKHFRFQIFKCKVFWQIMFKFRYLNWILWKTHHQFTPDCVFKMCYWALALKS